LPQLLHPPQNELRGEDGKAIILAVEEEEEEEEEPRARSTQSSSCTCCIIRSLHFTSLVVSSFFADAQSLLTRGLVGWENCTHASSLLGDRLSATE
jgi:hypothetical protein